MITYVKNSCIFESAATSLVNPVNTKGVMGKGLALEFKKRFKENYELYLKACQLGDVRIGKVFATVVPNSRRPAFIINFPTKNHWVKPSKLEWISQGLCDLRTFIEFQGVCSVAIPALGAGLGGLSWKDVKFEIEKYLSDLNCNILVYEPLECS